MTATIEHPNRLAHANDANAQPFAPHDFRVHLGHHDDQRDPYPHCSYCGSITVADALRFFRTQGTKWSASDWKYGWPHKFYLDVPCEPFRAVISKTVRGGEVVDVQYGTRSSHNLKFYTLHLKDATPQQLTEWNEHVAPVVGVQFEVVDGQLRYTAWQGAWGKFGTIGTSEVR